MKKYDLEIIIGWECNNNCIFCSNRSLREIAKKKGRVLITLEEVVEILKSHNSKDVGTLFLLGGEPTIHKDFFKIIRIAKSEGYNNIYIITNGRMFKNRKFCERVVQENIDLVFSIHGDIPSVHDRLTRTPGSFQQMVSGMNNLRSLGQAFKTNTVINKINYKRIPKIINLLSRYNPSLMLFSLVSPTGISNENIKDIIPHIIDLKPVIKDSVLTAKRLNQNLRFMDVPLCIMGKYERYMHEKDFERDRRVVVTGLKDFFYLEHKNENEKTKPSICSGCKKDKDCRGIWKDYIKLKSHAGLKPFTED